MLFNGDDTSNHANLWITNGTGTGTTEIAVTGAFSGGLNPSYLTVLGNEVLFSGEDSSGHINLWITNGTTAGTSELAVSRRLFGRA